MATCGLIIMKMKADVELAISLPVYFKSVKNEDMSEEKKQNKTKKKRKKKFPTAGVEPWTFDV